MEQVNRMLLILILATVWIAAAQTPALPPDFAENLAALERAREAHPDDLQTLDALAGSYAMAAEYRKAIAVLQQMRTLSPQDRSLELRLARNYTWAGDSKRAIQEYNSYLRAAPEDRQATIELIRLRRYRGDYSQAEKLCNRLLSAHPDDAEVLALKAEVLHWAGRPPLAGSLGPPTGQRRLHRPIRTRKSRRSTPRSTKGKIAGRPVNLPL